MSCRREPFTAEDGDILHRIGLLTKDFRVYGFVSRILRREGIPYLVLGSPEEILSDFDLIVTSHREEYELRTRCWDSFLASNGDEIIKRPLPVLLGINLDSPLSEPILCSLPLSNIGKLNSGMFHEQLLIGIDPGEHVGIVVLGDGSFLMAETLQFDIKNILVHLEAMMTRFSAAHVLVRVGNGEEIYSCPLINAIHSRFQSQIASRWMIIEEVNERNTSSSKKKFSRKTILSIHECAALMIAERKGTEVREPIHFMVTSGQIKDLKRKSRLLSKGRVTISTKLAMHVINGEMTLADAVIQQEKK